MSSSRLLGAALLLSLPALAIPPDETDRLLLSDPALPRLALRLPVPASTFLLELSPVEPGLEPVRAVLDSGRLQLVEVPGCDALARLFVLPVDPSEGTRRIVLPGALTTSCGSGFPAFVDLVPGSSNAPVPFCGLYRASELPLDEGLLHETDGLSTAAVRPGGPGDVGSSVAAEFVRPGGPGDVGSSVAAEIVRPGGPGDVGSSVAAVAPDPSVPRVELWLDVRLIERHAEGGETVRIDTRVPFLSDRAFALQGTWAHRDDLERDGSPLGSRFFLGGGTLALAEEGAELAVTASFVREVPGASEGDEALAVRVSRQEGWWLARWGETARKTLSAARDGIGELVVELTLRPQEEPRDRPDPLERF